MQELRTFTEARENDISNPVNIRKRRNNFYKDLKLDLKKKKKPWNDKLQCLQFKGSCIVVLLNNEYEDKVQH